MENKNKYLIITFIFIAVIIITGTFAWLSYRSKKTSLVFTVGDMNNMQVTLSPYQIDAEIDPELDYTDSNYVNVSATNNQNEAMNYTLYYDIEEIDSALQSTDFKYTIERSIDNGTTYTEYITGDFSTANTTNDFVILDEDVPEETTYKYKVYIWVDGYTNPNTGIEGATFKGELKADIVGLARAYLTEDIANEKSFYKEDAYREKIVSASFVDYINVPANAITTYDLKSNAKHPITAWLVPGEATDTYELYIGCNETIYGKTLQRLFQNMKGLKSVDFSNLDTSETTDMSSTFWGCSNLIALDLSNFNTSSVTGMTYMFANCSSLTSLNVSNFDTSNVISMSGIFQSCIGLTVLDVSNFDTSNVTSMAYMFADCSGLTSLDLSNFNTSKVTTMHSMFINCSGLTSLDITNFDTSNVKIMLQMFSGCSKIVVLDLSNFNTSKVTNMQSMFRNCSSLTSLDLSNFNTANVNKMSYMFFNCINLISLDLSNFNTSNVNNMAQMFQGCSALTSLDLSSFNTENVITMYAMFYNCKSLQTLDLSNFKTPKLSGDGIKQMFSGCDNLESLNISNIDTSNITNMYQMFWGCYKLTTLDLSNFDTSKVTNTNGMFNRCTSINTIYVSDKWNMDSVTDSNYMFLNTTNLPNFSSSATDKTNAHYGEGGYLTYKAYTPPSNS